MIACENKFEDLFYILKGYLADLNAKDIYGNSVYHYICLNSICLGIIIINTENLFKLTPKDYCKIAYTYYTFV